MHLAVTRRAICAPQLSNFPLSAFCPSFFLLPFFSLNLTLALTAFFFLQPLDWVSRPPNNPDTSDLGKKSVSLCMCLAPLVKARHRAFFGFSCRSSRSTALVWVFLGLCLLLFYLCHGSRTCPSHKPHPTGTERRTTVRLFNTKSYFPKFIYISPPVVDLVLKSSGLPG